MKVNSKKLLSWLCVIAMVLSLAPAMDLSNFAVETNAVAGEANLSAIADPNEKNAAISGTAIKSSDYNNTVLQAHVSAGTCPICGDVEWTELGNDADVNLNKADYKGKQYHYYFGEGVSKLTQIASTSAAAGASVCIWLNRDITASGVLKVGPDITFNIFGEGKLEGTGTYLFDLRDSNGKVGTLNLFGGKFVSKSDNGAVNLYGNGVKVNIYAGATIGPDSPEPNTAYRNVVFKTAKSGVVNMYGGTIQNGVTDAADKSGNVDVSSAGTFNMYGGTITGGTYVTGTPNTTGGNIRTARGANVNIYGGTIENGRAASGGNIHVYYSSGSTAVTTVSIYGGTIQNGEATNGGNVYVHGDKNYGGGILNISGTALISGGVAKSGEGDEATYSTTCGGNVYVAAGGARLIMTGGTITGGKAEQGGNVYTTDSDYSTFEFQGGEVTGGDAQSGGNVYAYGKFIMSGASTILSDGTATYGGNLFVKGGNDANGNSRSSMSNGTITDGKAASGGGNVYISEGAAFTMTGEGVITRGTNTSTMAKTGSANVLNDRGTFNGGEGIVVLKDGYDAWYATNTAALNAYNTDTSLYVTLTGKANITKNVVINTKGNALTLSGSGVVTLIDTANHKFDNAPGAVTVEDTGITIADEAFVNDRHYVTVFDGKTYSAHYVVMELTNISLRPSQAGLYYKTLIRCDDVLAGLVDTFGVVVDTVRMPYNLEEFEDQYSIRDDFELDEEHSIVGTSLSVFNILKDAADRDADVNFGYLTKDIYANLYITGDFNGDSVKQNIMGIQDETVEVKKNLKQVVKEINDNWDTIVTKNDPAAIEDMKAFVHKWNAENLTQDGYTAWAGVTGNIPAPTP